MDISTDFLSSYLIERDHNWESFEFLSSMAAHKKELITAEWRFNDSISSDSVIKIFKTFKLSYDEFIEAYLNR